MKKLSSFLVVLFLMLASFAAGLEYPRGDVNYDGQVSISDVSCLIDYLLNGTWPEEPVTPPDNHEWVDLGLPSGTLWATCNVGASNPEEYGDYFAWGETEPKEDYSWTTYKWCNGTSDSMTKYCTSISGTVDGKSELEPEDDAAYVNWGPEWRMPTYDQIKELINKCTWTWTTVNGVNGRMVTGPNGNTMFMPVPGVRIHEGFTDIGWGYYWSLEVYEHNANMSNNLVFHSSAVMRGSSNRFVGNSVRAVRAGR